MPNINLSKLNGQELRRLLDATRRRGDAALSYQVLQEMAVRREKGADRPGLGLLKRRSREPHIIDVDLADDSMEAKEELPPMPNWRAPPIEPQPEPEVAAKAEPELPPVVAAAPEPAAAPKPAAGPKPTAAPVPSRLRQAKAKPMRDLAAAVAAVDADPEPTPAPKPRSVWDAEPEPAPKPRSVWNADPEPVVDDGVHDGELLLHPRVARPTGTTSARRFPIGLAAGLLVGVAMGMGAGWSARAMLRETPVMAPAPPARLQTAALQIAPAAVPAAPPVNTPEPEPATSAEPDPPAELPPPDAAAEAPPTSSDAVEVAVNEPSEPPPPPERRRAEVVRTADATPAKACAAELTPADREICADPELGRLQRELRDAYAEALDAHQDRDVLRQRQLAWRAARNGISDPQRLARLYEERIRKLNAATAEARHQR